MEIPTILPPLGEPVSTDLLNLDVLDGASFGEILHAATVLTRIATEQITDPRTYHQVGTFADTEGADWAGFHSRSDQASFGKESVDNSPGATAAATTQPPPTAPIAPDNYYDTLPAIGHMLSQLSRFQEVSLTHYSRYLEASMKDQRRYLGTPYKDSHFKDVTHYLIDTMRISRHSARKIVRRGVYFAHRPGAEPQHQSAQPVFEGLAKSLAAGRLPIENADKIIALDEDLTKYSQKTHQPAERKDLALQAFESTLVEAGEAATPDELSKTKHRWLNYIAHWVCPDGPSPAQAMAKQADNELRMREHADGSATYSMHATTEASVAFKNFMLHQLNFNGSPVKIPEKVFNLLTTFRTAQDGPGTPTRAADSPAQTGATEQSTSAGAEPGTTSGQQDSAESEDRKQGVENEAKCAPGRIRAEYSAGEVLGPIETWDTSPDLDAVVAEDSSGEPVSAREVDHLDHLTTGQRLGAILVSLFYNMVALDPSLLGAKKAHGASAQLMIVQDIETAYHTLGIEKIPETARRPRGSPTFQPSVLKRPNPDEPENLDELSIDPRSSASGRVAGPERPAWTPYQSEAVNIGPIHPKDAEILTCSSELVGQIWDGPDTVLHQKRAQRFFTLAQRRAILARDKGCQAPGCTIPAVNCAIHHIKEWFEGGMTDETNAVTLCPRHHAAVHNGKWVIRRHEGLLFFQPARWLDPTQPLLRNVYWNI